MKKNDQLHPALICMEKKTSRKTHFLSREHVLNTWSLYFPYLVSPWCLKKPL